MQDSFMDDGDGGQPPSLGVRAPTAGASGAGSSETPAITTTTSTATIPATSTANLASAISPGPHMAYNVVPEEPGSVPIVYVPGTTKISNIERVAFSYRLAIVMVAVMELQATTITWQRTSDLIGVC